MSDDPRRRFLGALKRELPGGPLVRRRVLAEVTAHLEDILAELEAAGVAEDEAVPEALRRLGEVGTIATAFRQTQSSRRRSSRLRSPAWIAVGAMSLVTAWAAEIPQASGAKATTQPLGSTHSRRPARPARHTPTRRDTPLPSHRSVHIGRS